jgi:diacylglycerol kinase (ATP)
MRASAAERCAGHGRQHAEPPHRPRGPGNLAGLQDRERGKLRRSGSAGYEPKVAAHVSVVVNPRSGAGRAQRQLEALDRGLRRLGPSYELLQTSHPGHATQLARQAIASGSRVLAVVGGDGTLNEVCQAYVNELGEPVAGPPLALIPSGTGGDFARCCGFADNDLESALQRLHARALRRADLGVLRLHDAQARPLTRAFLNITSAGISGDVDERVERGPKWLGGKWAFRLATLGATLGYRNVPLEIAIDGEPWHQGPLLLVAIANGQFFGGGMHIAPRADWADGLFDVVCVGDLSKLEFLSQFPRVQRGTHLDLPCVRSARGRRVTLQATAGARPVLVDVDGETPGFLPLEARLLPHALELCVD